MQKTKKVFIGLNNVASVFDELRKYFKFFGWETYTVVEQPNHPIIRGSYDEIVAYSIMPKKLANYLYSPKYKNIVHRAVKRLILIIFNPLKCLRKRYLLKKAIKECDFFVFIWTSFDNKFRDYKKIRKAGKKIAVIFCGSDVRWYWGAKQEFEALNMTAIPYKSKHDLRLKNLKIRLNRIKEAEKYANFIFNKREQAQICSRPFYHYPMIVDVEGIKENRSQRKNNPVVLHAPSNKSFKGSKYILEAIEKLKSEEIEFTPKLLHGVKNEKAIEEYRKADIIIDQLFAPGAGKLASEALASGAVVLSFMNYDNYYQADYFKECPIVDISKETIYKTLKSLILDYRKRVELAEKSREYAEKHLHTKNFVKKLIDLYEEKEIEEDYKPTFFRDSFTPESKEAEKLYSQYIDYIKDCDWYNRSASRSKIYNAKKIIN